MREPTARNAVSCWLPCRALFSNANLWQLLAARRAHITTLSNACGWLSAQRWVEPSPVSRLHTCERFVP